MKLEELLGAELYAQVQSRLDEVNKDQPDKLKHVRFADLSEGEYVGRAKHEALEQKFSAKEAELTSANELIEQLKKGTKGNEELQGKITAYEGQVQQLQEELAETKRKSAIKVELLSEGAKDVDYLTFKLDEILKEKGEILELDENDNIKGWDDKLNILKTQFSSMFGGEGDGGYKPYNPEGLPNGEKGNKLTREELLKKPYAERNEIYRNDPDAYKAAMKA